MSHFEAIQAYRVNFRTAKPCFKNKKGSNSRFTAGTYEGITWVLGKIYTYKFTGFPFPLVELALSSARKNLVTHTIFIPQLHRCAYLAIIAIIVAHSVHS